MSVLATDLQSRLETWTRRAVNVLAHTPAAGPACAGAGIAEYLSHLSSVLETCRLTAGCPLTNLPSTIISGICSHMSLWDIMQLSLTSRGMHAALLAIPEVWGSVGLPSHERYWTEPVLIGSHELAPFLARSAPAALDLRLHLVPYLLPQQAHILASHMYRTTRLRIGLFTHRGQDIYSCWAPLFQEGLSEPAPQLTTLELSNMVLYSDVIYPGGFSDAVVFPYPLFSGLAPRLRTFRLSQILLPPHALCRALENVTTFSYDRPGVVKLGDLAHIFTVMPQLETLQVTGTFFEPSGDPVPTEIPLASSLRGLMLSFVNFDLTTVGRMVPLRQLRELRMEMCEIDPFHAVAETYPAIDSLCLLMQNGRPDGCLTSRADGSVLEITFSWGGAHNTRFADFCTPYPNLTCLEIHEFFWNHDTFGPPPALPNLTILCMHLARRTDYSAHWPSEAGLTWWHAWQAPGILPDPDGLIWNLPALREVHVTAAWGADVDAEVQAICESHCLPMGSRGTPMSVSLRDVAGWVRGGIAFDAAKLDVIGLSGLQAIDLDFAAAWEELVALSMSVEMTETPGRPFCLATGPRGYHEHPLTTVWQTSVS